MKRLMIAVAAMITLVACTKETSNGETLEKGALQTIKVNVAGFGNQTKTAVDTSGAFIWTLNDKIGIYPVNTTLGEGQTSQQIVFKINGSGSANKSTFTGTGWGLVTSGSYKYFSYYPYDSSAKYDEVAVVFADNLNQTTNASAAHVACNDYLYAPQIQPVDAASCVFNFKHLGVLAEFEITIPADSCGKKFTKMEVSSDPIFTVAGKYNPSSATSLEAPVITENTYTDVLKLQFNGGEGFTPNDGKIYAYFLLAPAATSGKKLNIKLWDEDNNAYVASITPGSNWMSQDYKRGKCTAVAKSDIVATNLSASGTANCYIVPETGKYKFRANVRGNGVDPILTDLEYPTIVIGEGYFAEVIWETVNTNVAPSAGTIVNNTTITLDGNYIVFDATGAQGNALIALKNSDSKIIWSWHIWSTNADLESLKQTYPNDAGVMMDRNLGALSATPGDALSIGFHYQWGRPFPITGYGTWDERMATTNQSIWVEETTTIAKGSLEYSSANPTHFLCSSPTNYSKGQVSGSSTGHWIWTADKDNGYDWGSMPAFWGTNKTMYDPCPIGWKVPDGGSDGIWSVAGINDSNLVLISGGHGKSLTITSPAAYYPFSLNRDANSGNLPVGNSALYWSTTQDINYGYCFYYNPANSKPATNTSSCASGCAIRACRE